MPGRGEDVAHVRHARLDQRRVVGAEELRGFEEAGEAGWWEVRDHGHDDRGDERTQVLLVRCIEASEQVEQSGEGRRLKPAEATQPLLCRQFRAELLSQ